MLRASSWSASPLGAAVVVEAILNGTAGSMAERHRQQAAERQILAHAILGAVGYAAPPVSFHGWMKLPKTWTASAFARAARERGVLVVPSDAFAVAEGDAQPQAVRLSVVCPEDIADARRGLERVAALLSGTAVPFLSYA
jgi:DNA-binding transcriptional MocR family regulator